MKVQFLGAAQTVTGSCYMIEACGARFTVDCGMHQGNKAIESRNFATELYRPSNIDFILITHAHIDHSGLLPRMVRHGFTGSIYCTEPTLDLLEIMLLDSAHIQETEARQRAEKYKRRGKKKLPEILYTTDDAQNTFPLLTAVEYKAHFEPHPGIKVTFQDAGHILGSASVLIEATENGKTTSVFFSGDLGRPQALIVKDPEPPIMADYIFVESTYGNRNHNNEVGAIEELYEAIAYSYSHRAKVIIPAFAVERTQELLLCLQKLSNEGRIPDDMPIYVDSPMAIRATQVFAKHADLFDDEAKALLVAENGQFALPNLRYTMSPEESRMINDDTGPAIILSASGMCNAGRIRHHLRHNLWNRGASIVFVGYQAVGTPGRQIVENAKTISLFGDDVEVNAKIFTIGGFSAHAGQEQILSWLEPAARKGSKIVLTHGEESAQTVLAQRIKHMYGIEAIIPDYLAELNLDSLQEITLVHNSAQAHPSVDWDFLTNDIENKWGLLKTKMQNLQNRPWVEQTELRDRMESLTYELTKLITRM